MLLYCSWCLVLITTYLLWMHFAQEDSNIWVALRYLMQRDNVKYWFIATLLFGPFIHGLQLIITFEITKPWSLQNHTFSQTDVQWKYYSYTITSLHFVHLEAFSLAPLRVMKRDKELSSLINETCCCLFLASVKRTQAKLFFYQYRGKS